MGPEKGLREESEIIMEKAFNRIALKGGWKITIDPEKCPPDVLEKIGEAVGKEDMPEDWLRLKSSRTSRVWKFSVEDRHYIFKEFLSRGPLEPAKALINGSRGERAWNGGHLLSEKGFLTPPLAAWGVKTKGILAHRNFIVTGFVPEASGVFTFLKERLGDFPSNERADIKELFFSSFGSTIGLLHRFGIIHGDLRLDNIMVRWIGRHPQFYFIDNERNLRFRKAPLKLVVKNLVQTNMVSLPCVLKKDRVRFYHAYLKRFPQILPRKKEIAERVWEISRERLKKKHGVVI